MKCKVVKRTSHRLHGDLIQYTVELPNGAEAVVYGKYPFSKDDVVPVGAELFVREVPLAFTSEQHAPPETTRLADIEPPSPVGTDDPEVDDDGESEQ